MKKINFFILAIVILPSDILAQSYAQQMKNAVANLDNARSVGQYQVLANNFTRLSSANDTDWKAAYYAAFCNTKIAWLYQNEPAKIALYVDVAEPLILKAKSLLDSTQHKELSEIYVVLSMIYRAKVFIRPMTNGRKFGPTSQQYLEMAKYLNPENPRVSYQEAWVKYYTPKLWGGNKKKARELAELGLKQLKNQPESKTDPRWGKQECEDILKLYDQESSTESGGQAKN